MTKKNTRVNSTPDFSIRLISLAVAAACLPMKVQAAPGVNELPSGAVIQQGQAVISQTDNVLNIQQNTSRLVTDWNTFNVGTNGIVNFLQKSSDLALNRVLSGDPSQILGQINAGGSVIIANPAGVLFGSSARIDVGSLGVVGQMPDADEFMSGNLLLEDLAAGGSVVNQGQITTRTGGFVVLAGKTVENSGSITAPEGDIALLAGDQARLELTADGLIGVEMDGTSAEAAIKNSGAIIADGGKVLIQSRNAGGALGAAINQTGIVRANTLALNGDGSIRIDAGEGQAMIAGTLEARGDDAGESGGRILVTGDEVEIAGTLNAEGAAGGGTVHVGGGWQGDQSEIAEASKVHVAEGAQINVDATDNGQGGEAVLWSAEHTFLEGTVNARGAGEGSGGRVEISSREVVGITGSADLSAQSGDGGYLLMDPTNLTVNTNGGTDAVSKAFIEDKLNSGTDYKLEATQNISIEASIAKTAGAEATLTFDAGNDITLQTGIDITSSGNGNALNLVFGAAPSDTGTISIFGQLATNGGDITFNKETYLRHETPISTKVTQSVGAGVPSGDVLFVKNVFLADDGYSVTINTQGSDSGGVFNNIGGNIQFDGQVLSAAPVVSSTDPTAQTESPQNLILDTTGLTGTGVTAGKVIFNGDIGSTLNPLRSLTVNGATDIDFNASTINLSNTAGPVITASTNFADRPVLNLHNNNVTINVTGGAVPGLTDGYTSYLQDSFDIYAAATGEQTLTINSDQSIKLSGVEIDANGTGLFNLLFNPNSGSGQGGVIMSDVAIRTEGGRVNLGSAGNYAEGVAGDTDGSDGIRLHNTRIETAGGELALWGKAADAAQASDTSGAGVRITGASTYLSTDSGLLSVKGRVDNQTNSGNKDALVIGEGVSGQASLITTTGNIVLEGDASAVSDNVTGGNRYLGVLLANSAQVKTGSGDILIRGQGGGGNQNSVEQNHGIRLQDNGTSILSTSGDILLQGTSGGRLDDAGENSFGIYATGNNIYVGRDADKSAASGDVIFVADSMEFVNSASSRLQVSSDGHLVIRPQSADTRIEFGNAGSRPVNGVTKTLYLGEDWFNGSANSVFLSAPQVTATAGSLDSQQNLLINANAGGNFKLNLGGNLTADIAYSTDSSVLGANIQAAIQGVAGYEGTTVLNQGSGNYQINFKDGTSAPVTVADLMTGDTGRSGFADITIGRTDLSGNIVVNAPTSFRDDLTLLGGVNNDAYAAKVIINSALTLSRQPNTTDTGSLTIITDSGLSTSEGLVAKGVISTDELRLQGGGDFIATATNRIATLAADVQGDLTFTNGQALTIGELSSTRVEGFTSDTLTGAVAITPAVTDTLTGLSGDQLDLRVFSTAPGVNADLTQAQNITANTVLARVENGTYVQTGTAVIADGDADSNTATDFYLEATAGVAKLLNANVIETLAGVFSATSGLELNNQRALQIGRVEGISKAADAGSSLGQITQAASTHNGLDAADTRIALKTAGALTQNAAASYSRINAAELVADVSGGAIALDNQTNQIDLAALKLNTDGQNITLFNAGAMTIGEISGIDTGLITAGSISGVTPGANADVRIATGNGALTIDKAVTATGTGTLDLRAGGAASDLVIDQISAEGTLISSENGAIQLLAGNNISTTKATDGQALVNSTGSTVLLQAGNGIGSDTNRIEVSVPNSLAAHAGANGIWLRDLNTSALELGDASALNTADTFGGTVAQAGGVMSGLTTSDNGNITLTKASGDLTISDNISADGSGYIDLRTGATGSILINGGQLSSGTGSVQLLSAGGISTNTLNDLTDNSLEISTTGDVLLAAAAGDIGSQTHRIEVNGATGTAAQSSGSQYLRHTGDMTVAAVAPVNTNTLDTAASLLALPTAYQGLVAGSAQVIDLLARGGLQLNEQVQAADGTVRLNAASVNQAVADTDKALTAANLNVVATNDVALNNAGNAVTTLAADSVNGSISYIDTNGLTVGTVDASSSDELSGLNAAGSIDVQTLGGDLLIAQAVGTDTGSIDLRALSSDGGNGALTTNATVTAGGDGNIDLRTTNGAITLNADVTAKGAGWIDARAGGITSDITLGNLTTDYAQLSTQTGDIQLLAGRDLLTTRATDSAGRASLSTNDGSVLLQAGGRIGTDANRIEIDGAAALAANADNGSIWLRKLGVADDLQIGGVEAFSTDGMGDTAAGGSYNASYAGLTTGGAGNISLTTQGGNLTLTENISADTTGYVDLRTAGTGAINLTDAAQISSGSGDLQLLAGGAISTDSSATELNTTGNALLSSGADIGSQTNRIDLNGVANLATDSVGSQYLAHTGNMTVNAVAATNTANTLDRTAASLNGLTAGDNQRIDLDATGALQLNDRVQVSGTTGVIRFLADSIDQVLTTGKALSADVLRADATGNIALNNPENAINTLAADSANGTISYVDNDGLTIGSVDGLNGLNAAGNIDVQTLGGDLLIAQAVGTDTGSIDLRALSSDGGNGALTTNATVTAGGDGNIDLRTTNGAITLNADVTANGAGWIDARSGGITSDITLGNLTTDYAQLSTQTGDIQLLAGRDLLTNRATDSAGRASLSTNDGSVLLQAGGRIGTDANRIEIDGAAALAANADNGSIWLRKLGVADDLQIGGVEAFSTDGMGDTAAGGSYNASYAGLTTGGAGNISLTTQGGNLTLTENISADTTGYVDLRTAGTGAINLTNAAQISSGSGDLQLLAGGAISTDSSATELNTTGNALLSSGAGIGSLTNRIDLNGVANLATDSVGSQYLAHTGNMTVNAVAATNTANTLDRTATSLKGLTAGSDQRIDLSAVGALALNDRIQIGGTLGVVRILADSVSQVLDAGKGLSAGFLRADATNSIALNNSQNSLDTLAADSANGTFSYVEGNGLTLGTVDGLSGVNSAGNLDVQTLAGDLVVAQALGTDSGSIDLRALNSGNLTTQAALVAGGNGNIDLRTTAGAVTLNANVIANGSGWIDVRSGGASDLTLGSLTQVRSASGQIQLLAGRDLISAKATSGVANISTDGSVLLQAGGNVGTDANRIEISNAAVLAANADNGSLWLRKLGAADDLQLGGVEALATDGMGDTAAGGSYNASYAGLTTGGAGNITLTTRGGNLTLIEDISADTTGYVDLRTAGTGAINFTNAAQVSSGSGDLQLLAGGAITSDSTATELNTTGDVLLSSGGAIGSASQRIELANVANLAAQSGGDQYLAHTANLTVDQVNAINAANTTDRVAQTLNGLNAADNQRIDLQAANALQLNDQLVVNGTGVIRLQANSIGQTTAAGKGLSADSLRADATNNIALNNAGNALTTLAADSVAGSVSYTDSNSLTLGTADGLSGVNAADTINVQSLGGDLIVAQALASDSGNIELSADNGNLVLNTTLDTFDTAQVLISAASLLQQVGAGITTGTLVAGTTGDMSLAAANTADAVTLNAGGNLVHTGALTIADSANLTASGDISLANINGPAADLLVQSDGRITLGGAANLNSAWIRSGQEIYLDAPLTVNSTDSNAAVLAAGTLFYNRTGEGANAIVADTSNWLIYDRSSNNYAQRMAGLQPDYLTFSTLYDAMPSDQVTRAGNGYYTGTTILVPDNYQRVVGGASQSSTASSGTPGQNPSAPVITASVAEEVFPAQLFDTRADAVFGENIIQPAGADGYAMLTTDAPAGNLGVEWPVIGLQTGQPFRVPLAELVGDSELVSVTADGQALPQWLELIGTDMSARLSGVMPEGLDPVVLQIETRNPQTGAEQTLELLLVPVTPEQNLMTADASRV